ncbi:hypothetical protein JCM3765_006156 [Sporobolomyces pararoseus]
MEEGTSTDQQDWYESHAAGRLTRQSSSYGSKVYPIGSETSAVPIAIASPTSPFSSSAHSFNLRSPPSPSSFFPSSDDPTTLLDGPLTDLLPPAIGSPTSGSSTDEGTSLAGWTKRENESIPRASTSRRIVSAPLGLWSTSPPRSSPLSQSFSSMLDHDTILSHYPSSPPSSCRTTPISSAHRRRRSSASLHQYPPFGSLVGSFENSLLSGRMSALPSKPLPFTCSIGVLGSRDAPKKLQCPHHLHVDFGAVFYSSKEDRKTSPYVGAVDLEGHFVSLLSSATSSPSQGRKIPKFPGYQVPVRGQVQIVLKNSNQTAFKPFLVPYDLEGLNRDGRGGRTFLRQKSYLVEREDAKGTLRFAIHLTFCSPPIKKGGQKEKEPKYYLYQTIRVVFASQAFDPKEKVRVVLEGPAEFLHGSKGTLTGTEDEEERNRWRESQYGDYRGPGEEWEHSRRESRGELHRKETEEVGETLPSSGGGDSSGTTTNPSTYITDSNIPTPANTTATSLFANLPISSIPPSSTVPLPFGPSSVNVRHSMHPHPLSISTTFSSPVSPVFPPLHPSPAPLTFDRVPSPSSSDLVRGFSRDRKQSSVSGLSLSRPNSPALFNVALEETREIKRKAGNSRERELCGR